MPFGLKPKCSMCKTITSTMWRKTDDDEVVCNSCSVRTLAMSSNKTNGNGCPFTLRKSTRAKSSKFKQQILTKSNNPKGKSRRSIFKKVCNKAPTSVATPVTSQTVFYKGTYFQVGDIVSVVDVKGGVYYAQLRGLLQDQYCEKSAVITWLLPTQSSPKGRFDPATYIIGPEEDIPRKLECFEFVCHAPSEYYYAKDSPYPVVPEKPDSGYVWTRVGPRIVPLPTKEEVFGTS
ncbi:GATA zinc finger domain-containing protein 1-like [Argiope bruennichi]|uniref:GATA zinc finger domain-containing protein 1 n=1 Tax=Argiope bruennichi TaxID=94029 RepID=A0A8T0F9L6_ARGBR|nr:GATA zinc finger domain-containing protein 1-like [Argiope bruennichi]KAF8787914.1 GATA zinc finger domain-containing protein 1 [Argiope bruennichi]